jgi:hypothetical protein
MGKMLEYTKLALGVVLIPIAFVLEVIDEDLG